jgi:rod shape-determining protein MreC
MKRAKAVFPIFLLLLLISFLFFFLQNPAMGALQIITLPVQRWTFVTASPTTPPQQLQEENKQLTAQLAKMQEIEKDNKALHDQFQTSNPSPQKLLPADVIGLQPNAILIDKGEADKVHVGNVVVIKDTLVGKITKVTPHISQVTLLTDASTSFTAETVTSPSVGIIKSLNGDTIILDNVVLSDKLQKNDLVVTKGDLDLQGHGYPPKLIVGKITSVDKQASNLFQVAKIQSLVDVSQVRMVFVMTD